MAQETRRSSASGWVATNLSTDSNSGNAAATNTSAGAFVPVSFETLAAFPIKVDWLINPTNSSFDTLQQEGEIPGSIKALQGTSVALQGYMKPLKQDAAGVSEFLLMRDHALCCQAKIPQINEWVHVRMLGRRAPFAHERLLTVRGRLQVGGLLGAGNVVSVYRLDGTDLTVSGNP